MGCLGPCKLRVAKEYLEANIAYIVNLETVAQLPGSPSLASPVTLRRLPVQRHIPGRSRREYGKQKNCYLKPLAAFGDRHASSFSVQSHFTKAFKHFVGSTPKGSQQERRFKSS